MTKKPLFSLRMEDDILNKIKYIAHETRRSTAKQIELCVYEYIKDYEKIHGIIDLKKINF